MILLPRRVKKNVVRSSVVAPSKPLQGFYIRVSSSNIGRPGVCHNINGSVSGTVQLVSGLTLPPQWFNHSSSITDMYPVEDEDSLQYPSYADKAMRLQSFRDWGGMVPPPELAGAGLFMVAPDVVKCCSCKVVVRGWKKEDIGSAIDIHCLNCIQMLNDDMASPVASQKPVINERAELPKSSITAKLTRPREQIILSERRIFEEGYNVTDTVDDDKARVVPVMCKVCQINQVDCVFLPCGHARTCERCARRMFNSGQPCYTCNRTVSRVHPMYL